MKNLTIDNPVALETRPVIAVGIPAEIKTNPIGIRGPNLSQNGPRMNLIKIVPETAAIEDVQISPFVKPSESCTSPKRGVMENLCSGKPMFVRGFQMKHFINYDITVRKTNIKPTTSKMRNDNSTKQSGRRACVVVSQKEI